MAELARQCSEDAAAKLEGGEGYDPEDEDDEDDEDGGGGGCSSMFTVLVPLTSHNNAPFLILFYSTCAISV